MGWYEKEMQQKREINKGRNTGNRENSEIYKFLMQIRMKRKSWAELIALLTLNLKLNQYANHKLLRPIFETKFIKMFK